MSERTRKVSDGNPEGGKKTSGRQRNGKPPLLAQLEKYYGKYTNEPLRRTARLLHESQIPIELQCRLIDPLLVDKEVVVSVQATIRDAYEATLLTGSNLAAIEQVPEEMERIIYTVTSKVSEILGADMTDADRSTIQDRFNVSGQNDPVIEAAKISLLASKHKLPHLIRGEEEKVGVPHEDNLLPYYIDEAAELYGQESKSYYIALFNAEIYTGAKNVRIGMLMTRYIHLAHFVMRKRGLVQPRFIRIMANYFIRKYIGSPQPAESAPSADKLLSISRNILFQTGNLLLEGTIKLCNNEANI